MRIGYSYIPPSHVNGHPIILDWFADDHVGFTAIEDTHIKVAYVQEPSDVGYSHHSVYLNTRVYPGISSNQFVVPNGWRAVSMYTHSDSSTLMIIEKVTDPIANPAHNFFLNPEPHLGNILLDPVVQSPAPAHPVVGYTSLSPVATSFTSDAASLFGNSDIFSISENDWMNPAPVSPAASSIPLMLPPYDKPAIHVNATLLPYGSVVGIQRLPVFIGCNLQVFTEGISYTSNYLKSHFTAAWTIISDARLMGRNYLTINQGSEAAFKSYCVQAITEMQTISNASPQPPESGLQCRETGETELLNLLHPDIIEILYAEWSAFIKSMRTCAQSFVEEPKKACLGGFSLKTKTSEEAKALIQHVTNMTDWSSDVTSIAFTFDSNFNPYRNKALLAMLAHRIIRPVHGRVESLLTLFPESYTSIPKHLISRICALIIAFFRTWLSDHNLIFTHSLDEEHYHQLDFLTAARSGTDERSMELERWLTTRSGPDGWETALRRLPGCRGYGMALVHNLQPQLIDQSMLSRDFVIFALIPPIATISAFLWIMQFSQPTVEVTLPIVVGVLWLALGAWFVDVIK
ncbi:hypothetical protein C8R48DRAFT_777537 [Suillus tomentosus]|nr:hypothetical protein C8R48DRAFT_777537 [Suillus tomentosus]